jgi:TPR repeat protein
VHCTLALALLLIAGGCRRERPAETDTAPRSVVLDGPAAPTCDQLSVDNCVKMAFAYRLGGKEKPGDTVISRDLFEVACSRGSAEACEIAGDLTSELAPGVQGLEAAADLYLRACNSGRPASCAEAGAVLLRGLKDPARGETALVRGCERGDSHSCAVLAGAYQDGSEGLRKDRRKAKAYRARATRLGFVGE